ncbi:MAG: VWA domain-containing protein [Verrucomicrobiales bacterium]|nr:VWA domain-containing protein [Verrucomicrobiales bacterium]
MIRLPIYSLFSLWLVALIGPASGQVKIPSFNFDNFSPGTKISINQVETTDFPRVKLFATVSRGGLPLGGLTAENFRVRENEADQAPIKVFVQRDAISSVLLLDVSGSMKGAIDDVKVAAIAFLKTLEEKDRVQVVTFHERIDTIYPLGSDFAAAERAILKIRHRGDTALYDGVYSAVSAIRDIPGRRAVVVLSDGVDDDGFGNQLSKRDLDEPLMLGIQSNIPLYTVGLGSQMDAGILKTLAGTTGAEYANAPTRSELEALYARIGQQLSSQYAVEYTTASPLEGGLREVKLDFVIPSRKPYAAPNPVTDDAGRVISYEAPKLSDEDIGRLAKMAGVGKFAKENKIKPLAKFIEEIPDQWPDQIPVYQKADQLKAGEDDNRKSFSFNAPEKADDFISSYKKIIGDEEWSIQSQTKAGNIAIVKAYKGQSEMTIGIQGGEDRSQVTVEYDLPASEPILVDKNSSNQIIAADGRDVVIEAQDGVIIVSGGCGKLTIKGGKNQVQCDVVKEVEIIGNGNILIAGSLGKGAITGDNNEVAWGSGLDGLDPGVTTDGSDNKVMELE